MSEPNKPDPTDGGSGQGGTTSAENGTKSAEQILALYAGEITDDTPIDDLPPKLRDYIKSTRKEARAAKDAKKLEAEKAEADRVKALEAKGEYETIIAEFKGKVGPLESRVKALTDALTAFNKARIDSMPESDRALTPESDDPIVVSLWLDKYQVRAAALAAAEGNGAGVDPAKPKPKPPNANAGATGAGKGEAAAANKENAMREARGTVRRTF